MEMEMDLKKYSFTKALKQAAEMSQWDDSITYISKSITSQPVKIHKKLQVFHFPLKHEKWNSCSFEKNVFYFFTTIDPSSSSKSTEFSLTIYNFEVEQGRNKYQTFKGLKGSPSCISSGIIAYSVQNEMQSESQKAEKQYVYKLIIIIGLEQGFLKLIELDYDNQSHLKLKIHSEKIQQKPIVSIIIADTIHFDKKNICFVLFEDSKVFIYNYVSRLVICIYQPPILSHDHALGFTLHPSARYFASFTRSGQIIFWEINEEALRAIQCSQDKELRQQKNSHQEQSEIGVSKYIWKFKIKNRVISVFPLSMLHTASIDGLKWISFMGNLLAMISTNGLFRIIAVNFQIKDQFIIIIQYQIPNGESISNAQLDIEQEALIIFKAHYFIRDKINGNKQISKQVPTKQTSLQQLTNQQKLLKSSNFYKFNFNGVESCISQQNRIQKLYFGEDLKISKVVVYEILEDNEAYSGKRIESSSKFLNGVVSDNYDSPLLMCRKDNGFYVGLFSDRE